MWRWNIWPWVTIHNWLVYLGVLTILLSSYHTIFVLPSSDCYQEFGSHPNQVRWLVLILADFRLIHCNTAAQVIEHWVVHSPSLFAIIDSHMPSVEIIVVGIDIVVSFALGKSGRCIDFSEAYWRNLLRCRWIKLWIHQVKEVYKIAKISFIIFL